MFKLKKFEVCPLTGHVDYELEFSIFGRPTRVAKGTYNTEAEAARKLDEMKRDYILFTLENYVNECRNLLELGISKHSQSRTVAIVKCTEGLHYLQDKQLARIAEVILKMEELLQIALPAEKTDRYHFLYSQWIRIINFSKETIHTKNEALCQA